MKLDKTTIFERDLELLKSLRALEVPSETEIILRTKGLEKKCVVWSTRIDVDTVNEKEEFIYTIFTRTVSLLIILVFPSIQQSYLDIINLLVPNRLIFWDEESEIKFHEIKQMVNIPVYEDDIDTSDDITQPEEEKIESIIE